MVVFLKKILITLFLMGLFFMGLLLRPESYLNYVIYDDLTHVMEMYGIRTCYLHQKIDLSGL